ncbi:MAG: multiheme c-type cytochrome [Gemmataceae bacterium]
MTLSARTLLAGLALAFAAGTAGWYFLWPSPPPEQPTAPPPPPRDPPPPDPRLTFATPYRNVRPEVKYIGDAACAGCHADIDARYHAHPMGRSAERTAKASPLERYGPEANNPAHVDGYTLAVERRPDGTPVHRLTAPAAAGPVPPYLTTADVAIGSGTRGRSYLCVDGGAAWQSPVSWFTDLGKWDKSPGYQLDLGSRRRVTVDCLFCHVDRVDAVPGSENRYVGPVPVGQPNVGCERCHGPGELHARERADDLPLAGQFDTSIVNPARLDPFLREDVCRQCHLQGKATVARRGRTQFEFRPGLPLGLFAAKFVRHPDVADYHRSVGQFEQMEVSKCYTGSAGKLGCISCHDPHVKPAAAQTAGYFRGKCLTCHDPAKGSAGCTAPPPDRAAKADSCVACHMPRGDSSSIAHASVTDHRIPRRPIPRPADPKRLPAGGLPILPYRAGPHPPPADERERDYGIALARALASLAAGPAERRTVASEAEARLTAAVRRWPGDTEAWVTLAGLYQTEKDYRRMYDAARRAADLAPDTDTARAVLLVAAARTGRHDVADAVGKALVTASPGDMDYRVGRIEALVLAKDWTGVEAEARAALAVVPTHPVARVCLAAALARRGDPTARAELDAALGLVVDPADKLQFDALYRQLTR